MDRDFWNGQHESTPIDRGPCKFDPPLFNHDDIMLSFWFRGKPTALFDSDS